MPIQKTPLFHWHESHDGRMVDFSGWSMPVQYSSIIEEHQATRTSVGLFDISHMARFRIDGDGALDFVDQLTTRKVADLKPSRIRYTLLCNEQGGILDDILVYHLESADPPYSYVGLVVNAGNREKIADWVERRLPDHLNFYDQTQLTSMIALQGPKAIEIAEKVLAADLASLKYYQGKEIQVEESNTIVSRTGYTGEDGIELVLANDLAVPVWEQLHETAKAVGGGAVGLGARDTLRLEAAMPLYGHELSEEISPIQAGLDFAVSWDHEFIGKRALEAQKVARTSLPVRVGVQVEGRRVPRQGYRVLADGQEIGHITSGSQSPTLDCPIAMAYVDASFSSVGQAVEVDVRGKSIAAKVTSLPFYKR